MSKRREPARLRRLLAIPATEVADLVVAQLFVVSAWLTVRMRRRGQLLRPVARPASPGRPDVGRLARIALAVDRVARCGLLRPTCLVRAIALERMMHLARAGLGVVKVGVLPGGDRLAAHAWIEVDGIVIGDEPAFVRRFVPLSDFSAMRS